MVACTVVNVTYPTPASETVTIKTATPVLNAYRPRTRRKHGEISSVHGRPVPKKFASELDVNAIPDNQEW